MPKTAAHEQSWPFYPQSLEQGVRSCHTVGFAFAAMYFKGVSTCSVEGVLEKYGVRGLSSSTFSRIVKVPDDQLEAWWTRYLG